MEYGPLWISGGKARGSELRVDRNGRRDAGRNCIHFAFRHVPLCRLEADVLGYLESAGSTFGRERFKKVTRAQRVCFGGKLFPGGIRRGGCDFSARIVIFAPDYGQTAGVSGPAEVLVRPGLDAVNAVGRH